ncbi:fimbria/pilus outer membrane usher protein [[Pantoea] beijingensis]|nr:fimbria/pilus outer membrane usher protein [[Pantoea] beijingensis]
MNVSRYAFSLLIIFTFSASATSHHVWVILNNLYKGRIAMEITRDVPCLRQPLLEEWGVRAEATEKMTWDEKGCLSAETLKQQNIRYFYDDKARIVTLLFPPAFISAKQNGISTSRWDDGINAAFINYHMNYTNQQGARYAYNDNNESAFADFDSGANWGPWRLRYQNSFWKDNFGQHGSYTRNGYLMRDIRRLRGRLTLGYADSPSTLFDSVPFRGVMLATDDGMLPDTWRNFSPLIKGVAHSNAEVTLRQAGIVIYQTFVAPGPFELKEIYPPSANGDLEITVKESDGSETTRLLPYASMPNLTHQGHYSYQILTGKYRADRNTTQDEPSFGQATLTYGFPAGISLYAGGINADPYRGYALGMGKNLNNWGALSLDVTHSQASNPRHTVPDRGEMYRLRYAKAFIGTNTNVNFQLRYFPAKQRYRTLRETIQQQKIWAWDFDDEGQFIGDEDAEKRLRWELNLNQNLSDNASLFINAAQQRYRQHGGLENNFQLGYQDTRNDIDYNIYLSHSRYPGDAAQTSLNFSLSIPFSTFTESSFRHLKLDIDQTLAKNDVNSRTASISGTALEDYSLSYQVSGIHSSQNSDELDATLGYSYNAGEIALGVAKGATVQQYNADISGSVLIHSDGVTFGQQLGETMALVELPNMPNVGIDNQFGVTTDKRGFALVSYLTPYRVNHLTLDTYSLPEDIMLPQPEAEVVPTRGAIVFARFLPPEPVAEQETTDKPNDF